MWRKLTLFALCMLTMIVVPGCSGRRPALLRPPLLAEAVSQGPWVGPVDAGSARILWLSERPAGALEAGRAAGGELEIAARPIPGRAEKLLVATLTGLSPGRRYRIPFGEGAASREVIFNTPPVGQRPYSFVVYGDTRSRPAQHRIVADAIAEEEPEFVLHTGDLVGDGRVWEQWPEQFFGPAGRMLSRAAFYPARGNHERDAVLYRALFELPGNELYYSFDWGNAHFVVLDTFQRGEDRRAMLEWFERDLEQQQADWVFVAYHVPTFNLGGHGFHSKWGREDFLPVMYEHGVDFVLTGHSHLYERFLPIAPEGQKPIHFVVTGGGGAPPYPAKPSPILVGGKGVTALHYCRFTVEENRLTMVAKRPDGSVLDRLVLRKEGGSYQPDVMRRTVSYELATRIQFALFNVKAELAELPAPGKATTARLLMDDLPPETRLRISAAEGSAWEVRPQELRANDDWAFSLRAPDRKLTVEDKEFEPPLLVNLELRCGELSCRAEAVRLKPGPLTLKRARRTPAAQAD